MNVKAISSRFIQDMETFFHMEVRIRTIINWKGYFRISKKLFFIKMI